MCTVRGRQRSKHVRCCAVQKSPLTRGHKKGDREGYLGLDGAPLHPFLALLLALLFQKLPLLVGAQAAQLGVALLLLQLVGGQLALLGLFLLIEAADLGNLLVARLPDAAQGFGAEVRVGSKGVGEAEELSEDGEGRGVVGLQLEREVDALAGLGVVEAGGLV